MTDGECARASFVRCHIPLLCLLAAAAVGCMKSPPPPPSPLPLAACSVVRSVRDDADLLALYARVTDQLVAGTATPLAGGTGRSGEEPDVTARAGALRDLARWLKLSLERQQIFRDGLVSAWYKANSDNASAGEFLDGLTQLQTNAATLIGPLTGYLAVVADDLEHPIGVSHPPGELEREWRRLDCAMRSLLEQLSERWGCTALVSPEVGWFDVFRSAEPGDFPYATWTAVGLPQCEGWNGSDHLDCLRLLRNKPFLPRCDDAPTPDR